MCVTLRIHNKNVGKSPFEFYLKSTKWDFQHFCQECKCHAHIGDVFVNILISHLIF